MAYTAFTNSFIVIIQGDLDVCEKLKALERNWPYLALILHDGTFEVMLVVEREVLGGDRKTGWTAIKARIVHLCVCKFRTTVS